jgi:general secretion pathway protein G
MASPIENGKNRRAAAFTLIELLVVMVIIASLLSIAVPRYFKSLDRAKEVVLAQDLAVMREAIDHYYGDRARFPETLQELVDERYLRSLPVDPMTKSADTWVMVPSEDPDAQGIWDVKSGADGETSRGIQYAEL